MMSEATVRASSRDEPVIFWSQARGGGASTGGRETRVSVSVTSRYHFIVVDEPGSEKPEPDAQSGPLLPQPSPLFWRQAWIKFQRALDPLALPKPLPQLPWHKDRTSDGSRRRLRGRG